MEIGKLTISVDSSSVTKAADEVERLNIATSKMIELQEKIKLGDVMTSNGWVSVVLDVLYEEALDCHRISIGRKV